jgi:hypothetical protein
MKLKNIVVFLLIALLYNGTAIAVEQERAGKIVLFPFDVEAAGKYSGLRDGLRSMLAGKLAGEDGVVVLDNTLSADEQQMFLQTYPEESDLIFTKIGAGKIGAVTLSLSGEKVVLQMAVFSEDTASPFLFESIAENESEIIDAVEDLSGKVLRNVFSKQAELQAEQKSIDSRMTGIDAFQTVHPEKQFKQDIIAGAAVLAQDGSMAISRDSLVRRRAKLDDNIVSLVVEDIDGDGTPEIAAVSEKDLKLYHYDRGILQQVAEYRFKPGLQVHAINIADLDGDERVEVYLSAVMDDRFASMIVSWEQETGFQLVAEDLRWAIRPLDIPGEGRVLAGQAAAPLDATFLGQEVVVLKYDSVSASLDPERPLVLPPGTNLFDFIYADVDGDGLSETVAITTDMKLVVYDRQNRPVWRSEKDFGGSKTYFGSRWREDTSVLSVNSTPDGESYLSLQYIPVRLVAKDLNNDGKVEILSAENSLSTFRMLKNLRSFSGGRVVCFSWAGYGLQELWTTDKLDGYISDFSFTFVSKDLGEGEGQSGNKEGEQVRLVVGQMPGAGPIDFLDVFAGTGNLVIYDFMIGNKSSASQDSTE